MIQLFVRLHTLCASTTPVGPHIMGQEYCTLGSFYYNNKILFYGKMCYLYCIVYTTNTLLNSSVLL